MHHTHTHLQRQADSQTHTRTHTLAHFCLPRLFLNVQGVVIWRIKNAQDEYVFDPSLAAAFRAVSDDR